MAWNCNGACFKRIWKDNYLKIHTYSVLLSRVSGLGLFNNLSDPNIVSQPTAATETFSNFCYTRLAQHHLIKGQWQKKWSCLYVPQQHNLIYFNGARIIAEQTMLMSINSVRLSNSIANIMVWWFYWVKIVAKQE